MKITLKEAYEMAKKALPGKDVEIEVSYGTTNWQKEEKLKWSITAATKNDDYQKVKRESANDEIFAIALSTVVTELKRAEAKPADDVVVETNETGGKEPAEKEIENIELPF